ncbi:MAG: ATP-grasp domain-containing protein [Gammaproteobacteria bacterium]
MRGKPKVLIAALSGQALANSAKRAGYGAYVLDVFGDTDTRRASLASEVIGTCREGFDAERLISAALRLYPRGRDTRLVYGSGFEHCPDLLARLGRKFRVVGTRPEVIRQVKDPVSFFCLLERLGIPYPETTVKLPRAKTRWLIKRTGAAGGGHIRLLPVDRADIADERHYYQRRLEGRSCSLVFLANGKVATVLGYNTQWHAANVPETPFLYGGAVSAAELEPRIKRAIEESVAELVRAVDLRGLCGLDFIVQDNAFWVLELNPRPPATFELHEQHGVLFHAHLEACEGRLVRLPERWSRTVNAHAVLYADRPLSISMRGGWPAWVSDRPADGTLIPYGDPICTVHAGGRSAWHARQAVQQRLLQFEQTLMGRAEVA